MRVASCIAMSCGLLTTFTALADEKYLFPARGTDLGAGHYWVVDEFSEGPYILDLKIRRWDATTQAWTSRKDGITAAEYQAAPSNDKHLTFGMPLYAPIEGEVISCWRNNPDNPKPGEKLDAVNGSGVNVPKTIFTSGNHMIIKTPGGRAFLVAHMQQGTVPAALCPKHSVYATDVTVRLPSVCPDTGKPSTGFPQDSYIPEGQRPKVKKGQFIGRAGNSGNSTGPHIHIHAVPLSGNNTCPAVAMPFYNAWRQDLASNAPANPGAWEKLNGSAITDSVGNSLILPGIASGSAEVARHGLSASMYQQNAQLIAGSGYRMHWVDAYRFQGQTYYDVIFRPADGTPWAARHGLDGAQYQAEYNAWKDKGYRPIQVETHVEGNEIRYAAIFVKDGGPAVAAYHGLSAAAQAQRHLELTQQGWKPTVISVVSLNGQRYYAGLYEKTAATVVTETNLTAAGYQQAYTTHQQAGRKLVYLNTYDDNGQARFVAIWRSGVQGDGPARHGMTSAEYQTEWSDNTGDGYLTEAVTGYVSNGERRYAAYWRK
ncbi:hypothetical protein [Chitinimonas lacunae]|uniref:M23 family metallopeptidase n=1 Tax=Chitinimonas lacunae TaxID=1963018 RepID=A0ABV8MN26_9NEIS